jgi:hypothetical protein
MLLFATSIYFLVGWGAVLLILALRRKLLVINGHFNTLIIAVALIICGIGSFLMTAQEWPTGGLAWGFVFVLGTFLIRDNCNLEILCAEERAIYQFIREVLQNNELEFIEEKGAFFLPALNSKICIKYESSTPSARLAFKSMKDHHIVKHQIIENLKQLMRGKSYPKIHKVNVVLFIAASVFIAIFTYIFLIFNC